LETHENYNLIDITFSKADRHVCFTGGTIFAGRKVCLHKSLDTWNLCL